MSNPASRSGQPSTRASRTRRREQRSAEAQEYRRLYSLTAWRGTLQPDGSRRGGLRGKILSAHPFCKAPGCGVLLRDETSYSGPDKAVVHHIKDHKGDIGLFLDPENCEPRCKACHDRDEQRAAHGTLAPRIGPDGWPID